MGFDGHLLYYIKRSANCFSVMKYLLYTVTNMEIVHGIMEKRKQNLMVPIISFMVEMVEFLRSWVHQKILWIWCVLVVNNDRNTHNHFTSPFHTFFFLSSIMNIIIFKTTKLLWLDSLIQKIYILFYTNCYVSLKR